MSNLLKRYEGPAPPDDADWSHCPKCGLSWTIVDHDFVYELTNPGGISTVCGPCGGWGIR